MKLPLKRLSVISVIALLISFVFTTSGINFSGGSSTSLLPPGLALAQGQAPPAGARPRMSDEAFTNVQVLKGIPVDEFIGTMGLFSAALSVCCGDCHTGAGGSNPHWEADPVRKQIARRMIRMVNTINKENFNGRQEVTCWTCHRGSQRPSVTPAIDLIYGEPIIYPPDVVQAAPANATYIPSVDQIFDKYIQAIGGAQRLASLTSYTAKGTSHLFGEVNMDPVEIYAKAPDQLATIVHEREGDLARVYNGRQGWVMLPLTVVGEFGVNGSALEGAKLDAQLAFPAGIKPFFRSWRVSFPAVLNGRDVYVVQGTGNNGLIATFFFDKETGLLNRVIRYATSAMGRVPVQIDYSDYRPVEGVMMPYKWTYAWLSGREEYELTEVQPNVPVDASKFAQPVQRAR